MNKKDFYGIRLNNYFSPSCCSSYKMYFGTLDDIKTFIEKIEKVTHEDVIEVAKKLELEMIYFLTGKESEEK